MKLVITHRVEKQMKKIGLEPTQVMQFLMKHLPCSKRLIKLCSPLKGVGVYKAYFDNLRRGVFYIHGKQLSGVFLLIYIYSLLYFVYHLYFGFMSSTQINFRIPADLKNNAMKKAQKMGYNLNGIVKIFLYKFVDEDDILTIRSDIRLEKIFDRGISKAFMGKKSKRKAKVIGKLLGA